MTLCALRATWAGSLLLGLGLDSGGRALAFASLAAGAAALFLESEPPLLRAAQQEGCCSFTVSTLEEAVRTLKNEVRQGRALTVGLRGTPSVWLEEAVRRGLQPQVLALNRPPNIKEAELCETLQRRGAQLLPLYEAPFSPRRMQSLHGTRWQTATDTSSSLAERRERDALLQQGLDQVTSAHSTRVRNAALAWLCAAPSLFPRDLARAYVELEC